MQGIYALDANFFLSKAVARQPVSQNSHKYRRKLAFGLEDSRFLGLRAFFENITGGCFRILPPAPQKNFTILTIVTQFKQVRPKFGLCKTFGAAQEGQFLVASKNGQIQI